MLGQILPIVPYAEPSRMSTNQSPAAEFTEPVEDGPAVPAYRHPYVIQRSYAFSSNLPQACYEVMVYGDAKARSELRRAVLRTFAIRLGVTVFATLIVAGLLTMLYIYYGGFYSNFFVLCLVFIIYIASQFLWFLHYYRSTKSKDMYLQLNKMDVRRFHSIPERETSQITYTMASPPPTYQISTLEPPAYIDSPQSSHSQVQISTAP